ncbi:MAG: CDP-alcohol phosphatidyltransferase family protein [Gemmatimonadota bacterium]
MSLSLWAPAPERVRGKLRVATLPNLLSLTRVLFLVPILYLLRRPDPASDLWVFVLLFVAGLSDLLDGFLARARGEVSPSGKIVDPLADKILIGGLILYLAVERDFPLWLVVLVLVRDLGLVLMAALFLRRDRVVFAADWSGKLTTFFLLCLIVVHVLEWRSWYDALTVLAAVALGLSYFSYGRRGLDFLRAGAGARA